MFTGIVEEKGIVASIQGGEGSTRITIDTALEARSGTYVNQRAGITYRGDGWRFQAAVHGYQLATITSVTPYERLPQLRLDGADWLGDTGLRFGYNAEYAYFDRNLSNGFLTGKDGIDHIEFMAFIHQLAAHPSNDELQAVLLAGLIRLDRQQGGSGF